MTEICGEWLKTREHSIIYLFSYEELKWAGRQTPITGREYLCWEDGWGSEVWISPAQVQEAIKPGDEPQFVITTRQNDDELPWYVPGGNSTIRNVDGEDLAESRFAVNDLTTKAFKTCGDLRRLHKFANG